MDCIFCGIAEKKIPSNMVYEDERICAFHDISPAAPVHILIIPKKHIKSANEIAEEDSELIGHIILTASKLAKELGFAEDGYRIVNNCGQNGGQTVGHLHFHLLAGRAFTWPAG